MNKKLIIPAFFLFVLLLSACEKIIDIDLPASKQKTVLNSIIKENEIIYVFVGKSRSVFSQETNNFVTNAKVEVFENGELFGEAAYFDGGWYTLNKRPKAGANYLVKATLSGLEPLTGETTVPRSAIRFTTDTLTTMSEWGEPLTMLKIEVQDDVKAVNYYMVNAQVFDILFAPDANGKLDSTYATYNASLFSDDPSIISTSSGELLFSDETFISGKKKMEAQLWKNTSVAKLAVTVNEVSESYYKYKVTFAKYFENNGNPLAEPVQVFSNVNNGIGIVGGLHYETDTIYFNYLRPF